MFRRLTSRDWRSILRYDSAGRMLEEVGNAVGSHAAVIASLCRREVRTRFIGDALGYAWAYILPLGWIAFILLIFLLIGRRSPVDAPSLLFLLSGFIPYLAFRNAASAMGRLHSTARRLGGFQHILPVHMRVAAFLVEAGNALLLFALAWPLTTFALFIWRPSVVTGASGMLHDPMAVILSLLLSSVFGCLLATLVERLVGNPLTASRLGAVILRPFFYVSGIFFLMRELPPVLLDLLWWNPLLHLIDLARGGIFHEAASVSASWPFVLSCLLVMLWLVAFLPDPLRRGEGGGVTKEEADE